MPSGLKFQLTKKLLDNPENLSKELGPVFEKGFIQFLDSFPNEIPEVAKTSHISVLEKEQVPQIFLSVVKNYTWKVHYSGQDNFILGDVGVVGSFKPDNAIRPLIFYKKNLLDVFLPISRNHILIGQNPTSDLSYFSPSFLNTSSAHLSREFFISAVKNDQLEILSSSIGCESSMVSPDDITTLTKRLQKDWFKK